MGVSEAKDEDGDGKGGRSFSLFASSLVEELLLLLRVQTLEFEAGEAEKEEEDGDEEAPEEEEVTLE